MKQKRRIVYGPENLSYGKAIEHMKMGGMVARKGWNGKGMFVFIVNPNSRSQNVFGSTTLNMCYELQDYPINILNFIAMRSASGDIVFGWLASQTDMLSEDWTTVKLEYITDNP